MGRWDRFYDARSITPEEMLAQALARLAAAHERSPDAYRRSPTCGQRLACPDANPRLLRTGAGDLVWRFDRDGPKPRVAIPPNTAADMAEMTRLVPSLVSIAPNRQ